MILRYKHHVVVMTMNHSYNCVLIRNDTVKLHISHHKHSSLFCLHAKPSEKEAVYKSFVSHLYANCSMPTANWMWTRKLAKVFVSPCDLCTNCQTGTFILGHLYQICPILFSHPNSKNQTDYPKWLYNTMWANLNKTMWFYYRDNNIMNAINFNRK